MDSQEDPYQAQQEGIPRPLHLQEATHQGVRTHLQAGVPTLLQGVVCTLPRLALCTRPQLRVGIPLQAGIPQVLPEGTPQDSIPLQAVLRTLHLQQDIRGIQDISNKVSTFTSFALTMLRGCWDLFAFSPKAPVNAAFPLLKAMIVPLT